MFELNLNHSINTQNDEIFHSFIETCFHIFGHKQLYYNVEVIRYKTVAQIVSFILLTKTFPKCFRKIPQSMRKTPVLLSWRVKNDPVQYNIRNFSIVKRSKHKLWPVNIGSLSPSLISFPLPSKMSIHANYFRCCILLFYFIYRCKCNGHASRCEIAPSRDLICHCQHNTTGPDCNMCKPFFNDRPWARATEENAMECLGKFLFLPLPWQHLFAFFYFSIQFEKNGLTNPGYLWIINNKTEYQEHTNSNFANTPLRAG